ncbi:uncharacterized protein LOC130805768 [Amaranthus tricolor]|uniref:uncharacterized protein LOC130805768 n=1 Tax=Amaranthus tricolor TaxID=29722 RepID=UPI00258BA3D3|nr:uncharacterized protein LOC130805768 [Amaranthus tricolor]
MHEKEDRIEKRVSYKEAKRAAKKAVTEAKNRGYEDLYRKLDTKEEEKKIFKLARTRSRQRQDLETVKYIKDEGGRVFLRQEDMKTRRLPYFSQLLNESGGPKEADNQIFDVQRSLEYGSTSDITTEEVGEALKKMGRTKAVGPNNISIKDEGGRVFLRQEDMKTRRLPYFSQLLNESGGPKKADNQIFDVQRSLEYGSTSDITTEEVGESLKKMGRTKAVGLDNISIKDNGDDEDDVPGRPTQVLFMIGIRKKTR